MNESKARSFLLVRAIESEDVSEAVLTREDRQYATGAALAEAPASEGRGRGGTKHDEAFLARRSAYALGRVEARFPSVGQVHRRARWPAWVGWALPLAALMLGLLSNEIDSGQRLNIIAFPLLGMIAWNLVAYILLGLGALRRLARGKSRTRRPNVLAALLQRFAGPGTARADTHQPIGRALARFGQDWLHFSSRLTYSRASRTLHLAAAGFAAGVLLGMYLRALGLEYRAGWESTFIGPGTLHGLLGLVLGPASELTGIGLPSPERLEALRWGGGRTGENAGPWIHLYATTAALFIIGPRLVLAGWHALRAARISRHFPVPGASDFYVRRLLRDARGAGSVVRVIPYSFHPPERSQRQLERLLTDVLGDKTHTSIDPPIPYGEEDEWLGRLDPATLDADHLLILFNLSATPEAENQGALASGLARRLAEARSGAGLTVLLDESAYRQRLAGQAGAEARVETRRLAWERMLAQLGIRPISLDLDSADTPALARNLEGALMQPAVPAFAGGAA